MYKVSFMVFYTCVRPNLFLLLLGYYESTISFYGHQILNFFQPLPHVFTTPLFKPIHQFETLTCCEKVGYIHQKQDILFLGEHICQGFCPNYFASSMLNFWTISTKLFRQQYAWFSVEWVKITSIYPISCTRVFIYLFLS